MKVSCQIKKGAGKEQCEDHALICLPGNMESSRVLNEFRGAFEFAAPCLLAVADGVGGNPGGNEASGFVLRELLRRSGEVRDDEKALEDLARSLNRDLVSHAAGIPGKETMATTFTALLLDDTGAWHVHTGNTRLAVMSGMFIRQITTDHTTWQWFMDSGNFEAADRCNRCEIQSCLGAGSIRYLTRLSIRHFREPGSASGVYILTSDGIHEYTDADFMEDVMGRPEISDLERTDLIMEEALKNESPDDKTILIVRC